MRQALEMALETLEESQQILDEYATEFIFTRQKNNDAIAAIKEALAQPETPYEIGQRIAKTGGGISHLWSAVLNDGEIAEAERGFKEALAQPEQEPVALYVYKPALPRGHRGNVSDGDLPWVYDQDPSSGYSARMLVYTTPPQRTWVGLTDDELVHIGVATGLERAAAYMIEAKLKEKNT